MSGSVESVPRNACVHRPRFTLSSKKVLGNGVRTHAKLQGKNPLAQRRFKPAMLHHAGQGAQHTTD